MSRYPRRVRAAAIKCIPCNAPVVQTTEDEYVCVKCGISPVRARVDAEADGSNEVVSKPDSVVDDQDLDESADQLEHLGVL